MGKKDKAEPKDWFLPEESRDLLREKFKELQHRVVIEVFTKKGENDPFNQFTVNFTRDLGRLSDKIEVNFNDLGGKKAGKYDVTRSPTVLFDPGKYSIRYTGAPAGEEGRSFIETILMFGAGESGLTEASKEILGRLEEKRHVRVFVTPGCPYCPGQVVNAFRAAYERPDLVSAECVEATEAQDLARQFKVGSVPHTVVNDTFNSLGLQPQERFMAELVTLESQQQKMPGPAPAGAMADAEVVDLIIVGAGPAGLTAGIYAQRSGMRSVVLEKEAVGGLVATTPVVENYPGFKNIPGQKLMELLEAHARGYVDVIEGVEVEEIKVGKHIEAHTNLGPFVGRALIIASGTLHRKLEVPGEDRFHGKGVSYCATCDGYLYKDKAVIMVGGGNTALTDALYLKNLGAKVKIVHRRDEFRAEKALQESVEREKIPIIWNGVVEEIIGGDSVTEVKLKNTQDGRVKKEKVDGVFVAVGEIPTNQLAKDIGLKLTEEGYIEVDRACRTNIPRVYAAGDITGGVRQIVTALAEGATASLSAFEDLAKPYWK